ncbi:hypothetical protein H1R20_g5715, partial [Candolleomyces eurysporus]
MDSVESVVRGCYEEYRAFDKAYCRAALSSLRRQDTSWQTPPESREDLSQVPFLSSADGEFVFHDYDIDQEEDVVETGCVDTLKLKADTTFQPHPAYELCTSVARNIKVGDDPDYMPFAPFGDDPSFEFSDYNEEYGWLAWQAPKMLDPDLEIISIEALSLLINELGIAPEDVEELGLFPARYPAAPSPAVPRLSKLVHKRDFPTDLPSGWRLSLPYHPPYASGPSGILDSFLSSFCHNPNCLTGYCTTHMDNIPPPIPPPVSNLWPATLDSAAGDPCGKDCFLAAATSLRDINSVALWTEDDKELLKTVLTHSPDALPCDLAVICRKLCFEVAKYRRRYFDSLPRPGKERAAKRQTKKVAASTFQDNDSTVYKPFVSFCHLIVLT